MYTNSSKKSSVSMIVQSMISPCDSIESLDEIFLVMVFFKISELSFLLFPYPALQYIRSSVWHMSRCQRTWFQFVFYRPWLVVVFMCRCGPNLKPVLTCTEFVHFIVYCDCYIGHPSRASKFTANFDTNHWVQVMIDVL